MTAKCCSFKLGSATCTVLSDGEVVIGKAGILKRFPDVDEAEYRQAYADMGLSLDAADRGYNVLLVGLGEATVLVDAGEAGRLNGGLLPESLRLAGIAPDAITLVVITHTHGDHVQGLLTDGSEPAFPNATYVMSREEMAFWRGCIDEGTVDHKPIAAMMQAKGLRLINMDEPIIPGLSAVPIPGHTPGQIGVLIESGGEGLLHLADLLHSPMQFAHPEWSANYDLDTGLSVPTRRAALGRAADENLLALFYHLTFPGLGRVRRAGSAFVWEPVGNCVP